MKLIKSLKIKFKYQIIIAFFFVGVGTIVLSQTILQRVVAYQLLKLTVSDIKQYFIPGLKDAIKLSLKLDDDSILLNSAQKIKYYQNINSFRIIDAKNTIILSNDASEMGKQYKFNLNGYAVENTQFSGKQDANESEKLFLKSGVSILSFYYYYENLPKKYKLHLDLSISKNFVNDTIKDIRKRFIKIGLGISILSILFALLFSEKISEKIIQIKDAARIIGSGDFGHRIIFKALINDEIIELSDDINKMAESLKGAEELKLKNERIEQELRIAEQIQLTLLPKSKPALADYEFGSIYYSAKEIGGDYYDWVEIDDKHLGIVCADVSGKGVPAALVMAMTRSIMRASAQGDLSPYELLTRINRVLKTDIKKGMFVSMWYGILNIDTGHIRYANAGHNPLLVYRSDKKNLDTYETLGSPLGILGEKVFNKKLIECDIFLNIDDVLIQYTDGVTEAFNDKKEMYDDKRFADCICSNAENCNADEIITAINNDVIKFVNGFEQSDDILIVAVKRKLINANNTDAQINTEKPESM